MPITIDICKFNAARGCYEPVRREEVTEADRDMLLTFFGGKPPVKGFYQYSIPLPNGTTAMGYTLNPDLITYLTKAE